MKRLSSRQTSVVLLGIFLFTACRPSVTTTSAPESNVLDIIDQGIEAACKSKTDDDCKTIRRLYPLDFLSGFINLNGFMSGGPAWRTQAFSSGQQYRRAHADQLAAVMADLGYVQIAAIEGQWVTGFEASTFTPAGHTDQSWWVLTLDGAFRYLPNAHAFDRQRNQYGVLTLSVRMSGFLNRACADLDASDHVSRSPSIRGGGGFGHMGSYSCQIYATAIENLPLAQSN